LQPEKRYRAGIDIGGTFTDLVLIEDETGRLAVGKVLSTPEDPSEAVEEGLVGLLGQELLRPRPRRVAVGEVVRPQEPVDAMMAEFRRRRDIFVEGLNTKLYPDTLRDIAAAGHEVAAVSGAASSRWASR
jgi:hypothetical protein